MAEKTLTLGVKVRRLVLACVAAGVWAGSGADASAGVTQHAGLSYVKAFSTAPVGEELVNIAKCPQGTHVYSGGPIEVDGYLHFIRDTSPWDGPDLDSQPDDGWRVRSAATQSQSPYMFASAVCGPVMPSYRLRSTEIAPGGIGDLQRHCGHDQHALSGGERSEVGTGAIALRDMLPQDTAGDADLKPEDQFIVSVENRGSSPVTVEGYVVCGNPGPVHVKTTTDAGPLASGGTYGNMAKCPAQTHVYGGGIATTGRPFAAFGILTMHPGDSTWHKKTLDTGWLATTTALEQSVDTDLTVYAICGPSLG